VVVGAAYVRKVPNGEQVAKLQVAILRYLADHPHAADTVRGIARYWIGDAGASTQRLPPLDTVQRALDTLAAQERITCTTLADGARVYASVAANRSEGATRRERSKR
jgi:hypothetical protein